MSDGPSGVASDRSRDELPPGVAGQFEPELRWRLLRLRRSLHRHPELSGSERPTQRTLAAELEELEELRQVAGTGLVARVRGRDPAAPTVAIRGDIDALPIAEATGLAFASEEPGVMHACGHDVHATWTIGAAHLLAGHPAAGDVLVVLQPAEERAKGARAVLESGALDGARAIFGGHVDRQYPVGAVVVHEGPVAASADFFAVQLDGAGGHGARPHQTRDPIAAAAALVTALYATIPRRLAESIAAAAHGVKASVDVDPAVPPIVNPPEPVAWARAAVWSLLRAEGLVPLAAANMAGEDFAFYMEQMPGCFVRVGAREPGGEFVPAHSPRFYAADGAIFVGAAVLAETARRASAALAGIKGTAGVAE